MDRDTKLIDLRPTIESEQQDSFLEEQFQNQTIHSIVKFQYHLVIRIFENYLQDKSINFSNLTPFQQRITLENAVKKDLPLRHTLIGCIVGLFTAQEYSYYFTNRIAIHKRITTLLIQLLSNTLILQHT